VQAGAGAADPAQVIAVAIDAELVEEAAQAGEVVAVEGRAADPEHEAVGEQWALLGDAMQRRGEVAAAAHVVLGRDLEEGDRGVDRPGEHVVEEGPAQPETDAGGLRLAAQAQVPSPQAASPEAFLVLDLVLVLVVAAGLVLSAATVGEVATGATGVGSAAAVVAGGFSAPQEPSPLAPQDFSPPAALSPPQEPSPLAPQDFSPSAFLSALQLAWPWPLSAPQLPSAAAGWAAGTSVASAFFLLQAERARPVRGWRGWRRWCECP
jgi:hypothetical protein